MAGEDSAIEQQYDYDAYGNQREITGQETAPDANPFRYSGEYYDNETGYIYLRARYYDPAVGAFINEDPIRADMNWYGYCAGNPVRFADPSGLAMMIGGSEAEDQQMRRSIAATNPAAYQKIVDEDKKAFTSSPAKVPDRVTGKTTSESQLQAQFGKSAANYNYNSKSYTYDPMPAFSPASWENTWETNCYTYAMGMMVNPSNGERFGTSSISPGVALQRNWRGTCIYAWKKMI